MCRDSLGSHTRLLVLVSCLTLPTYAAPPQHNLLPEHLRARDPWRTWSRTRRTATVNASDDSDESPSKVNRRQDVCDRVRALQNGSLELRQALSGVTVHGAVTLWDEGLLRRTDTGDWSGFHYELMKALSIKGNFDFILHEHAFDEDMAWNGWLAETIELYDINVEYWMPTARRSDMGAFPVFGFFDTSTQFAVQSKPVKDNLNWFSFMTPLRDEVWITLAALACATGWAYCIAEAGENEEDLKVRRHGYFAAIVNAGFLSFFTVTGAGTFTPKTWAGKLITWSWAWCILLFGSAYTANLAAHLIAKAPSNLAFSDVHTALQADATICVWSGTAQEDQMHLLIAKEAPQYAKLHRTSRHPLDALLAGDCQGAIAARTEVASAIHSLEKNPCCTLAIAGPDLTFTEGSWMVKNDYTEKCSVLVRDVLYVLTSELAAEGLLEDLVDKYMSFHADEHCFNEELLRARCPNGKTTSGGGASAFGNKTTPGLTESADPSRRLKAKAKTSGGGGGDGGAAGGSVAASEDDEVAGEGMGIDAFTGMFLVHGAFVALGLGVRFLRIIHLRRNGGSKTEPLPAGVVSSCPHGCLHSGHSSGQVSADSHASYSDSQQAQDQKQIQDCPSQPRDKALPSLSLKSDIMWEEELMLRMKRQQDDLRAQQESLRALQEQQAQILMVCERNSELGMTLLAPMVQAEGSVREALGKSSSNGSNGPNGELHSGFDYLEEFAKWKRNREFSTGTEFCEL
eukprot:TRINITY_DN4708_c0_g2_i1.p1 TRINITY_DN4708_c0_g2~~TRINITY_DN4708_c0_g2_i1.p1  ORF type:complete len:741 (-),score=114.36 TRINITY_DN4708_c0_g2_i1:399-2621(-)